MIGGVLVERTVKEVLPALETNKEQVKKTSNSIIIKNNFKKHDNDQLSKLIESLQTQIIAKGKEINDYREKHNIR